MRKQIGAKTYLAPMPVLILGTYNEDGTPNAMNAAYGGMVASAPASLNIFVSEAHKTSVNLKAGSDLTVHLGCKAQAEACDYVGLVSANNGDKMAKTGWTITKSENVNAPIFEELPIALECKVVSIEGTRVLANIIDVSVDEAYVDDEGNVDLGKMELLCFDPAGNSYRVMGEEVGKAFSIGNALK